MNDRERAFIYASIQIRIEQIHSSGERTGAGQATRSFSLLEFFAPFFVAGSPFIAWGNVSRSVLSRSREKTKKGGGNGQQKGGSGQQDFF